MKRLIITSALTALLHFTGIAQPIATAADVAPNFTGNFYFAPADNFSPGNAGENQTWNYASLNLTLAGTDTTIPVAGSAFVATFPTANYCYKFSGFGPDRYYYHKLTAQKFEILSLAYTGATGDNYTVNPRTFVEFPYTFNKVYNDTYQTTVSAIPVSVTATYDAYGTLILPFGTFTNVIRQKIVTDGQTDYIWFNVSPFFPLLQTVLAQNSLGLVQNSTVLGVAEPEAGAAFCIAPNPTEGMLSISSSAALTAATIEVYDALGKRVLQNTAGFGAAEQINIDLRDYRAGLYIIKVTDNEHQVSHTQRIIKK